MKIGMETERERRREQQEKEVENRKKEESAKKDIDYFLPSPIHDPSFKEDALPLFDSLIPTSETEEKEEEKKDSDPITDYYPQAPYTLQVMKKMLQA